MLKTVIVLVFVIVSSLVNAGERTITFKFRDSKTNLPILGIEVQIFKAGTFFENSITAISSKQGIALLNAPNTNRIGISIQDPGGRYSRILFYKYEISKGIANLEFNLYYSFDKQQFLADDGKYGTIKEGDLDSVLNRNGQKCGCLIENLQEATFPGGESGLQEFIANNLAYPQESIEMNESGTVYISFVVEKDGTLSHFAVQKSAGFHLDKMAMAMLRKMPKWLPARCDGMTVRFITSVPINFQLN